MAEGMIDESSQFPQPESPDLALPKTPERLVILQPVPKPKIPKGGKLWAYMTEISEKENLGTKPKIPKGKGGKVFKERAKKFRPKKVDYRNEVTIPVPTEAVLGGAIFLCLRNTKDMVMFDRHQKKWNLKEYLNEVANPRFEFRDVNGHVKRGCVTPQQKALKAMEQQASGSITPELDRLIASAVSENIDFETISDGSISSSSSEDDVTAASADNPFDI